jgi:hypothetical protein
VHNVNIPQQKPRRVLAVIIVATFQVTMAVQRAESAQPLPATLRPAGETAGSRQAIVEYLTGSQFEKALSQPVSISWQERQLRSGIRQLSESREVAVLLDRRVDPEQTLTLGLSKLSLQDILATIATECGAGISVVGNAVYIGPAKTAARLRTLVELRSRELVGENAVAGTKRSFELLRRATLTWQDLDRPADIVTAICHEAGLQIDTGSTPGLTASPTEQQTIPHDLWAEATIPRATITEKLILVLAQFDLSFEWQPAATRIRLVPMPENVTIRRTWPRLTRTKRTRVSKILPQLRGLPHDLRGSQLEVTGTVEQLEDVDRLIYPERYAKRTVTRPAGGKLNFTFEIRAQLGSLLKALPEKSDIRFEYDAVALTDAGVKLDRGVEMKMKNASLQELCEALFKDSGITWKISGHTVTLTPASK